MSERLVFGHAIDGTAVEIAGPEAINGVDLHQLQPTAGAPLIVYVSLRSGERVSFRAEHLIDHGRSVLAALGLDGRPRPGPAGAP